MSTPREQGSWRDASLYLLVNMVWMSMSHWSVHVKNLHVTSGQLFHGVFYTGLLSVPWKWWMLQNVIDIQHTLRNCDGWGCLLLASHHTGPGFNLGPLLVGRVVDKMALGQIFLGVLKLYPIIIIPPMLHANSLMYHCYTNRKPHSSFIHFIFISVSCNSPWYTNYKTNYLHQCIVLKSFTL